MGPHEQGDEGHDQAFARKLRLADHILDAYGISEFLGDIDRGRDFYAGPEGGSVVATALDWIVYDGFEAIFCRNPEWTWRTAADWRARHTIALAGR